MIYHYFYIVNRKFTAEDVFNMAYDSLNLTMKTAVDDDVIQFINKTFFWINSIHTDLSLEPGLPYYSDALILDTEIKKLLKIITFWIEFFSLSPENMVISEYVDKKGGFHPEYKQREVITQGLYDIDRILRYAIETNENILYSGI